MQDGLYCFYHVQGDKGDTDQHPNAFLLSSGSDATSVTLEEFVKAFPLSGTASFHFRFQTLAPAGKVYLDFINPRDKIPINNGIVIVKALRLDGLKCMSTAKTPLPLGKSVPAFRNLPATSQITRTESAPTSSNTGTRNRATATTPGATSLQPPPRTTVPVSVSSGNTVNTAVQQSSIPRVQSNNSNVSPTQNRSPVFEGDLLFGSEYSTPTHSPASVSPLKSRVGGLEPVQRPERVDEDLAGKSEWVQAKVMARREEEARKQEERLAAVRQAELEKARAEAAKDNLKQTLGPKLKEWAEGMGGQKREIRGLLSTLHNVLWPGAKWEEVPMSKLIDPNRVKFYFRVASRVVHPDHNNTATDEQKFISTYVFHVLEGQYRTFEASELNRA